MIISHTFGFVFVKNLKVAGTSLEVYLSPLCGPRDVFTPIFPTEPGHTPRNHQGFFNHMPAADIRKRVHPDLWSRYLSFTIERNPWDKTLSHYAMERDRAGGALDFDAYLERGMLPATHFIYTDGAGGEILVDRVLRYENLEAELGELFAELGVPFENGLNVYAKAGHRRDRRPYRECYTERQRDLVAEAFAWEIETFGYAF